jgi:sec-independent protein translocase protein TatB
MEILGVGMSELVFIIIIALIVLGPRDMQKAGRTIGRWLRSIVTSDGWKVFQQTSRELRTLPNKLMRDANEELNKIGNEISGSDHAQKRPGSFITPPRSIPAPPTIPTPAAPPAENVDASASPPNTDSTKDTPETNA